MDIHTIINHICPIPEKSEKSLIEHLSQVTYPKGYRLLQEGKTETSIYFMEKGIARAYAPINGEEVTFWFGGEGAALVSLKSYVKDEPGYETVELIEDASLYVLRREKLYELFEKDLHIANWGRKFAETELVKAEKKIISLLFLDASERYKELLENTPELLQRIPLGNIASYLGITQVSLSRIRAKIK